MDLFGSPLAKVAVMLIATLFLIGYCAILHLYRRRWR